MALLAGYRLAVLEGCTLNLADYLQQQIFADAPGSTLMIHSFFTGASLCRCITFPGHLLTSKEGETAPDGHNY